MTCSFFCNDRRVNNWDHRGVQPPPLPLGRDVVKNRSGIVGLMSLDLVNAAKQTVNLLHTFSPLCTVECLLRSHSYDLSPLYSIETTFRSLARVNDFKEPSHVYGVPLECLECSFSSQYLVTQKNTCIWFLSTMTCWVTFFSLVWSGKCRRTNFTFLGFLLSMYYRMHL